MWREPTEWPTLAAWPDPALVYTREPWWCGTKKAQPLLRSLRGVLLTSFCDPPVSARMASAALDGTGVRHWFAVQVATRHPKLTALPLGIDRRDVPAIAAAPRVAWRDRDILLHCNIKPRTAERRQVLGQFAHAQDWVRIVLDLPVPMYAAELGRSRFVLSPGGRSWDCYRTYEALAMGAVPIVRRCEPFSDAVEGLPVLMVEDWREVTRERLEAYEPPAVWNLERMTMAYWVERICHEQGQ